MDLDPAQSVLRRAREAVLAALATPDVDGHLCAVVLRRDRLLWAAAAIESLRAASAGALTRSADVAIVGLRVALSIKPSDEHALSLAIRRELARKPLPPMKRAHDDERLMLGIAAAVAAVPELLPMMLDAFSVVQGRSRRWDAVRLWARRLAMGGQWDAAGLVEAARVVASCADCALGFADAAAVLALAADLLDETTWAPDDQMLAAIDRAAEACRRATVLDAPIEMAPFDAALLVRGLGALPAQRLARRSVLDAVLATVHGFPAALQILSTRPRERDGLPAELIDEYDVQWLLHALLLPAVPDLVPEDSAPKLAGAGSRLDFTSRSARLGIEVKHLREKKHVPRMREELLVDERQYQQHPYVETVVCHVHDPRMHISLAERTAFERDLSVPVTVAGRTVNYVVRVR